MAARCSGPLALLLVVLAGSVASAQERPADVCLELAPGVIAAEEWAAVSGAVAEAVGARRALFPSPQLAAGESRLDLHSGRRELDHGGAGCLRASSEWTARFDRAFLEAGADQMLAEAPTTPGIDSDVTIEWVPEETRMRTRLDFAGPLDIPNGTCWIDDTLSVDPAAGSVVASGEQGVETSPFAEGACARFFEYLPDGGAGQQAVDLLPRVVPLARGGELRFMAEDVVVSEDGLIISGRLERG